MMYLIYLFIGILIVILTIKNWKSVPIEIRGTIGAILGIPLGIGLWILLQILHVGRTRIMITSSDAQQLGITLKSPAKVVLNSTVPIPRMKGVTSGHTIYTDYVFIPTQHKTHELVHVEQNERNGFFKQMALYGKEQGRVGYDKNKFEQEARQRAGQPER